MAALAAPTLQQEPKTDGLYDRDFYSWAVRQGEAMRLRDLNAIDWDNVIEEIEALARAERKLLKTLCAHTIEHLLKIEHYREASDKTLKHWMREIRNFRKEMAEIIKENPGLKGRYDEIFAEAWESGRRDARDRLAEYDEDNNPQSAWKKERRNRDRMLPAQCPYRLEEVTAFDLRRGREPRVDAWPPSVARVLNARLDTDFPVRSQDRGGRER